ncbi:MAG: HAD family hydrolase [Myxococcota bacterium]
MFDKLLVLDLDETLIHATTRELAATPDFEVGPFVVYRRPGVEQFLEYCLGAFAAVGVWTSSTMSYAAEVIEHLVDPKRLHFLWARERCTIRVDPETREYEYLKDLKKLRRRGFDKRKIIAVDDTPAKFQRSYGNLVRIRAFEGEPEDRELQVLTRYLQRLGSVPDVRAVEKRFWRTQQP